MNRHCSVEIVLNTLLCIYLLCSFKVTNGQLPDILKIHDVINFNETANLAIEGEKLFKIILPTEQTSGQPLILNIMTAFQVMAALYFFKLPSKSRWILCIFVFVYTHFHIY